MTSPTFRIRKMTLAYLPAVLAIDHQAFRNPWTAEIVKQ